MADELNPGSTSSAYDCMKPYWEMVDAILGGAPTMRAAGERYLPRFQNEKATKDANGVTFDPYEVRRKHAPFTNIYDDISRNLASKPFAKELKLEDKTPDQYKKLSENIDGQGNNLHVFGEQLFRAGLDKAIDWVLVDYTKVPKDATLADERNMGARPYWVRIPAERMLAVYSDFVNGQEIIVHARIYEPITRRDGFGETFVKRVRILNRLPVVDPVSGQITGYLPATWEIWEATLGDDKKSETWNMVDNGDVTIKVIPLVPFHTGDRVGSSWEVKPPLKGIAFMQVDEFQQESNLKNLMDLTCYPMLTGNGVTPPDDGVVPVGPRAVLFAPMSADGTFGSWQFIEPTSESIQKVMDRLEKTKTDMRDLGMQPLTQANLTVITTGQVAVKANSAVQAWAIRFKDAIEQCWKLTAQWIGAKDEPEVVVHMDFKALDQGTEEAKVLSDGNTKGIVSKVTVREQWSRLGILGPNFDESKEEQRLAEEQQGTDPEQPIDPVTGHPIDPTQQQVPPLQ